MNPKLLSVTMIALALALVAASILPASASDALVQPIPTPDMSKLPVQRAEQLREDRKAFEDMKMKLVGAPLAEEYALMGADYARSGLYDAAAVAFDNAVALAPNDARWLYSRGVIARMQKRDSDAVGYLERALTLDKIYLPIRIALVSAQIQHGELDAARKLLEEYVATQTGQAVPYSLLGDIALRQKRYPDAVDQFNRALKIDPKATRWYSQLADAYAGAGNAKAAADARAKVGTGAPELGDPIGLGLIAEDSPPAPASKQGNLAQAGEMFALHQYAVARQKLDAALKEKPDDVRALILYARVEATVGNVAQARMRANAAVGAAPKDAGAQTVLGLANETANDEAGAQRAYEKAIELDPQSSEARVRLGNSLMRARRYEDAAAQYRAVTQSKAANAGAWSRLVAAGVATGRCADAIKDINAGLAKDSTNGQLMQLFVRTTSTCSTSSAEEKKMALDYGGKLYRQTSAAPIGEAYALALAANGKWDDAVRTEEAAMFVLVRNGGKAEVADYRETLRRLRVHQLPDRPWPATSALFNPPRSMAAPKPAASPPAPPPAK